MGKPSPLNPREIGTLMALVGQERLDEAERMAQGLLTHHPDAGMLWKVLSVALVRQGKDALPALRRAAELLPADVEAQCNLGAALHDRGQWTEALAGLRRVLGLQPDHLEALVDAANALKALGRPQEAVALYQRALELDPGLEEAHNNLGNAFLELRRYAEAAACYRHALRIRPDDAQILCNLGTAQRHLGRLEEALTSVRRAVARNPALAVAHHILGDVLRDLGQRREALSHYSRAAELDPGRAENHCNLGTVLFELRRIPEAVTSYRRALALAPHHAPAHLSLGLALRQQRRPAEAEASCRAALTIDPDYVEALAFLGELQADRGRFVEAEALFEQAIALDPNFSSAYASVATHRKMTPDDSAWRESVEALLARPQPLGQEISLRYALGKYCDDVGRYAAAFEHYRRANELTKRYGAKYDPPSFTRLVDQLIGSFDGTFLRERCTAASASSAASASELPVFIIGMPRSGTSLAEQILASHPAVFGAGEVTFWNAAYRAYQDAGGAGRADPAQIPRLAEDYLEHLARTVDLARPADHARHGARAERVVDKMPANFLYAGLIHAAFPKARIIHMQRHPIDTCLSIYFQNFFNIGPYANDLGALAHYHGEYRRITDHWRAVLPGSTLLEIPYEGLIDDPARWSRRMVEFIGLPWDPRCLEFHQTDRVVITASKWQVRQKISKASAGRWRNYEQFVGPLQRLA